MSAYPDTSFLCAPYRHQANSPHAAAYFQAMPGPLEVSTLLLYEFKQSVRFQIRLHRHDPKKGYPKPEGMKMLADLKSDLMRGAVVVIPAPWPQVHAAGAESSSALRISCERVTSSVAEVADLGGSSSASTFTPAANSQTRTKPARAARPCGRDDRWCRVSSRFFESPRDVR